MFNLLKRLVSKKNSTKEKGELLGSDIQRNLDRIKEIFINANDIVIRAFRVGSYRKIKASIVFIDGLVDTGALNEHIIKPLVSDIRLTQPNLWLTNKQIFRLAKEQVLSVGNLQEVESLEDVVSRILSGNIVLFLDGIPTAFTSSLQGWEARGIEEPETEAVVRGPREGFTETLRTNTAQLRRKIKSPNLKFEIIKVGRETQTDVCVTYIKGIANDKVVEEVRRRIKSIDTDSILESGYIEQFIEDGPFSIFPTVGNSEKPDVVGGKLLEGRVGIITDGTPFVLTVPFLFIEAFQVSEDYYSRPYYSTLVRWFRFIAFFFSIFSPSIYVALTTFHQEMIPTPLLVTMAASKEGTPFPALVEAIVMGVIFEILREAGVRLPRPVGQAVSIVGAMVIGEAAVSAGLIGAPMVIVIAITAISSFVVPVISDAGAVMRLFLVIMSGFLGQFGLMLGVTGILTHMVSLRSFGAPYLSPVAPTTISDLKDLFIRAPWWAMTTRPRVIGWKDPIRQGFRLMPEPPDDDEND